MNTPLFSKLFSCQQPPRGSLPNQDLEGVYKAMFNLIAEKGWHNTHLAEIAERSFFSLSILQQHYLNTDHLMETYLEGLLIRLFNQPNIESFSDSPVSRHRDYLFELLMNYLDLLQPDRAAYQQIQAIIKTSPFLGVVFIKHANQLLAQAIARSHSIRLPIARIIAPAMLNGWLKVIQTWHHDQTSDLSLTMKKLDQFLAQMQGYWRGVPAIIRKQLHGSSANFAAMHKKY